MFQKGVAEKFCPSGENKPLPAIETISILVAAENPERRASTLGYSKVQKISSIALPLLFRQDIEIFDGVLPDGDQSQRLGIQQQPQ